MGWLSNFFSSTDDDDSGIKNPPTVDETKDDSCAENYRIRCRYGHNKSSVDFSNGAESNPHPYAAYPALTVAGMEAGGDVCDGCLDDNPATATHTCGCIG